MKKITTVLIILLLSIGFSNESQASSTGDLGSAYLVKLGDKMLKAGNVEDAIHEYSKALLMNPDNELANQRMNNLGFDQGIYSGHQTEMSERAEYSRKLMGYKVEVQGLQKENDHLNGRAESLEFERNALYEANLDKDSMLDNMALEINDANAALQTQEEMYQAQMNQMQPEVGDVQQIAMHRPAETHVIVRTEKVYDHDSINQLRALEDQYAAHVNQSYNYEQELDAMADKYQWLRLYTQKQYHEQNKMIHVLEDYLSLRERSMENIKDSILTHKIDLVRNQHELHAKMNSMDSVLKENETIRERVDLYSDWMEDKNQDIEYLREQIASKQDVIKNQSQELTDLQQEVIDAQKQIEQLRQSQAEYLKKIKNDIK